MPQADLFSLVGGALVPSGAFAWFALRMSWAAAKRDAEIDGLREAIKSLKERVDDHDDLRERMARMEQAMHDARGSLQRIELRLTKGEP